MDFQKQSTTQTPSTICIFERSKSLKLTIQCFCRLMAKSLLGKIDNSMESNRRENARKNVQSTLWLSQASQRMSHTRALSTAFQRNRSPTTLVENIEGSSITTEVFSLQPFSFLLWRIPSYISTIQLQLVSSLLFVDDELQPIQSHPKSGKPPWPRDGRTPSNTGRIGIHR